MTCIIVTYLTKEIRFWSFLGTTTKFKTFVISQFITTFFVYICVIIFLFLLRSKHWMLLLLEPYAYLVYCCDIVNTDLENWEEIVSVIVNAFNHYFAMNLISIDVTP